MGFVLKLIGTFMTAATTTMVLFQTLRGSWLVIGLILGVIKVAVIVAFLALMLVILYLLLTSKPSENNL